MIFGLLLWLQTATVFHRAYVRSCEVDHAADVQACLDREPRRWPPCPAGWWTASYSSRDFATKLNPTFCIKSYDDVPFIHD
jgi:hypothetical protein